MWVVGRVGSRRDEPSRVESMVVGRAESGRAESSRVESRPVKASQVSRVKCGVKCGVECGVECVECGVCVECMECGCGSSRSVEEGTSFEERATLQH